MQGWMQDSLDLMPAQTTPPPSPPSSERAYAYTKDRIIRGELSGGQLVSEGLIGDALGISRTPVHEAFLRLDAEKLLALSSRKGAVVLPMAPQEARDVLEMREAIETSAARRLVESGPIDPGRLHELRQILDRQHLHVVERDIDAFIDTDEELHSTVVAASGNTLAVHFFAMLRDRQQRLRHQLLHVLPDHLVTALAHHRLLVDRLEASDADGYQHVLRTHLAMHQGAL